MQDTSPKDIIIAINDNAQDGTDISWLWVWILTFLEMRVSVQLQSVVSAVRI